MWLVVMAKPAPIDLSEVLRIPGGDILPLELGLQLISVFPIG